MAFFDFFSGLALGLSLIVAIGAQNAYVIRQGLRGEHVFPVTLTCALSDAILIAIGVAGIGWMTVQSPWLYSVATLVGWIFLLIYGALHLRNELKSQEVLEISHSTKKTLGEALLLCLALTWLNPHVYVETVFLIGSISTSYEHPWVFGAGAMFASFVFFFSIGYAARFLSRYLRKSSTWRLIDLLMAAIMWLIAYQLFLAWRASL